jgi:hypothetical protein
MASRPIDERVNRVAVRPDRGDHDRAQLVLDRLRLGDAASAPLHGLPVRLGRIRNRQGDVLHPVTVPADVK